MHVRVLFVEDSEADAQLALRRLRADGMECSGRRVETEETLVGALREQAWDLILSDFSLPSFDGLSALTIAVRESPQVPFIFVSGTIGEERAIEALRCGAVDYVLKSNLKRLAPAVRRALREASERVARDVAEARLRDVIDVARDWIWELDGQGIFVFSSDSVRDVLGVQAAQIQGTHYSQWLHDGDRERMQAALAGLDRDSRTLGSLTARWLHADGSTRWLERHALALVNAEGAVTGFRGADRDVTEREAQQLRIIRLTRILEMLSGINTAVVRIRDRMELLQEACRIAVTTGEYQTAVVSILDPGTRTARPRAWAGASNGITAEMAFTVAQTAAGDTSITGRVLRSGELFLCNDVAQLDADVASWPTLRNITFRAVVGLPLEVDGTPVGVLILTAPDTETVTNDELRLLGEVAANLSFALQYFEKENAVQFLSYFDPLTGLAKRVLLCERLAARMAGLKSEERQPAVAVLDIEHLSIINDSYGRHAGDHLLQKIGDRLKGLFVDTERLAYLGGGCFAIVLEDTGDQESALRELQQHTFALLQQPFRIGGHDIPVTVKSGLACRSAGVDAQTLVQNAEVGLRQAKAAGEQYHPHQ
ncbi:MAG TPA: diguanylate cyclase, partial [Steroidobacteraceae bacterium]|nr:diguanylate cyclase [Steroidobacteraceae bacterium]